MARTVGYVPGPAKRKRRPNGLYVVCRNNSTLFFRCRGCRDCGGDGYRKVGTKRRGRPGSKSKGLGGRSKRKPKGFVRRLVWHGVGSLGLIAYLGHALGTFGHVLGIAIVLVVTVLRVLHWSATVLGGGTRR